MTLYISRLRLSKEPSARALASIFLSPDKSARLSAQHQLIWSVFADHADRERDFLWREDQDGTFITLSRRPPQQTELFAPHQVKPFAPVLRPGDRVAFLLKANATRMKRAPARTRVDVVMDKLVAIPPGQRAEQRMQIADEEGRAWLERQGEKAGFALRYSVVQDYSTQGVLRLKGKNAPHKPSGRSPKAQLGVLDITGVLEVTEPERFVAQLAEGFGRAKAFGCGLMLIRRAPS